MFLSLVFCCWVTTMHFLPFTFLDSLMFVCLFVFVYFSFLQMWGSPLTPCRVERDGMRFASDAFERRISRRDEVGAMRLPACLHLLVLAGHVVLSQVMMKWMQCDCLPASTCQHLLVLAWHVMLSPVYLHDSLPIWAMLC
jgi:hypothetical protein